MATSFTIAGTNWDNLSFQVTARQGQKIKKLYEKASRDIALILRNAGLSEADDFDLKQHLGIDKRINKLLAQLAQDTHTVIQQGTIQTWAIANAKNDKLIEFMAKSTGIHKDVLKERYEFGARNQEALQAFQKRKTAGLNLSERIWKNTMAAKEEITNAIDVALEEGVSAAKLSRLFRQALLEPDKRFKKGSNNWKNYHPGTGVYKSSYKNAMRTARTEINMAYRESDHQRWSELDFVKGIEVRLSNNPRHCPVCASLAGMYPKDFKFTGWHPQCRCHAIPVMLDDDEYDKFEQALLAGEEYEGDGQDIELPDNFKKWMEDNKDRVAAARGGKGSLPYFIRDNEKVIAEGMDMRSGGNLKPKDKITTNEDLNNHYSEYAKRNPNLFARGFKEIEVETRPNYNGSTDMDGTIYLRQNIINRVKDALNNIKEGIPTTLEQETSLSTLHHEIMHNANKFGNVFLSDKQTRYMELANEWVSRNRLDRFMESLGGELQNKSLMEDRGNTAYNRMVRNYDKLLDFINADKAKSLEFVEDYLIENSYKTQINGLMQGLSTSKDFTMSKSYMRELLLKAQWLSENDFIKYLEDNKELFIKKS